MSEKNTNHSDTKDEIRDEYDFSRGIRGKYSDRYREGTNVVVLDPDVAEEFHDSATVNTALREYLDEHGAPPSGRSD